jgi:hypothetical protein
MTNTTCGLFKSELGTLMHALLECSHARMFWDAAKEIFLVKLPRLNPLTWAHHILCAPLFTQGDRAIITSVMYSIWTSRNKLTHREVGFNPAKSMEFIPETLQTWSCQGTQFYQNQPDRFANGKNLLIV